MTSANSRTSDYPIDPLFLQRWSPRAFDGRPLSGTDILSLFEAARWAPSASNAQPWRFLYARRETPPWDKFLDLLAPGNRAWAAKASLLIVLVSRSYRISSETGQPVASYSHSFDAGAAWASLAFQATRMGLQAHGMVGFDMARAMVELNVPEDFRVEAAIAVGRRADSSSLSEEQRAREVPKGRDPVSSIAFEGGFPPR